MKRPNYEIIYRDEAGLLCYAQRAYREDLIAFCLGRKAEDVRGVWLRGKRLRKSFFWPSVLRSAKILGLSFGATKPVMLKGMGGGRRSA